MLQQKREMSAQEYKNVRYWLGLGVTALALAGIYSIVLVAARGLPNPDMLIRDLFGKSLIVHVNLSVLVWFLCAWAAMATMYTKSTLSEKMDQISHRGWWPIFIGTIFIVVAPFDKDAEAYKNNYVPMLTSYWFELGISLVFSGAMLFALRTLFFTRRPIEMGATVSDALGWAVRGAAIIILFTCVALLISFKTMPDIIEGEQYFELLFWAGGHILQFAYTQILMTAWVVLFAACFPHVALSGRKLLWIFLLNTLVASFGIYGSFAYDVSSFEHREFFTKHMIHTGGLMPMLMLAYLAWRWKQTPKQKTAQKFLLPALLVSVALFLFGGALGLLIQGQDTQIPAHYHGAIIAVTVAAIGFAYAILQELYPHATLPKKLIHWQPKILGFGQFLHVSGLAWSGGYGALRKTPGMDTLPPEAQIALGVIGLGGLLAVIGGLMFVVIYWKVIRQK